MTRDQLLEDIGRLQRLAAIAAELTESVARCRDELRRAALLVGVDLTQTSEEV